MSLCSLAALGVAIFAVAWAAGSSKTSNSNGKASGLCDVEQELHLQQLGRGLYQKKVAVDRSLIVKEYMPTSSETIEEGPCLWSRAHSQASKKTTL